MTFDDDDDDDDSNNNNDDDDDDHKNNSDHKYQILDFSFWSFRPGKALEQRSPGKSFDV